MFEICLSCVAAEVLGITLTEVLGMAVSHMVVTVCEKPIEACVKGFALTLLD